MYNIYINKFKFKRPKVNTLSIFSYFYIALSFLYRWFYILCIYIKKKSIDGKKKKKLPHSRSKSSFPDIHMKVNLRWLSDSPTVPESLLGLYFVSFFCQKVFRKFPGDSKFHTTQGEEGDTLLSGAGRGAVRHCVLNFRKR